MNTPGPGEVLIIVQNKIAIGSELVEDGRPAFLSTSPVPYCLKRGCVVEGTQVLWTGSALIATCQTQGERMTNADEGSDLSGNPGVVRSARWYRVKYGTAIGYFPEIFVEPKGRGGGGLPDCDR